MAIITGKSVNGIFTNPSHYYGSVFMGGFYIKGIKDHGHEPDE